eukprot:TRINITY_DN3653_c0_g2_i1.p1 TRINITY_DN3653_c0_g2~~TRINITY_DN3653_c0_g2_i1.p1  ORF type:complete len:154 (+),score=7.35 TRINITY_DN3653_c0_g2_i1:3-464(+)
MPEITRNLAKGTIQVSYTAKKAGQYSIVVEVNKTNVSYFPYKVRILPGKLAPEKCILRGAALGYLPIVENVPTSLTIDIYDRFQNRALTTDLIKLLFRVKIGKTVVPQEDLEWCDRAQLHSVTLKFVAHRTGVAHVGIKYLSLIHISEPTRPY